MKKLLLTILIATALIITGCKENTSSTGTSNTTTTTVKTVEATDITSTSFVTGGVISSKTDDVIAAGICYGTSINLNIDNCEDYSDDYEGEKEFTSFVEGLDQKTKYYYRAYVAIKGIKETEIVYGKLLNVTTLSGSQSVPTIETKTANNVTASSFKTGGYITLNGVELISAGVCYGKSFDLNYFNCEDYTVDNVLGNSFNSNIRNLDSDTKYYYCAYATYGTNSGFQVVYGKIYSVTTEHNGVSIIVETYPCVSVGKNFLTFKGSYECSDPSVIQSKGFCYSINNFCPVYESDMVVYAATDTGYYFYKETYGLSANTKYYYRAFVRNSSGKIEYGSPMNATTTSRTGRY